VCAPPGKRSRDDLCEPLAALFSRHAKPLGRKRGADAAASPASSAGDGSPSVSLRGGAGGGEDVEAFRHEAGGSVDGMPQLPSPGGSLAAAGAAAAAAGFGRRSGMSGGSGSLLAQALAGISPKCVPSLHASVAVPFACEPIHSSTNIPSFALPPSRSSGSGRAGRASDAFGGGALRAGDLPGGEEDFDAGAVPMPDDEEDEDYGAPPQEDEYDALGGGGGGAFGGGLSAQFESALLETGPDATQAAARDPAATLSGVSAGVIAYFAAAFGDAESQDKAFRFAELCTSNRRARRCVGLVMKRRAFCALTLLRGLYAHCPPAA
jgi:hypothetical protein